MSFVCFYSFLIIKRRMMTVSNSIVFIIIYIVVIVIRFHVCPLKRKRDKQIGLMVLLTRIRSSTLSKTDGTRESN